MILVGENIHIISKSIRTAIENKDKDFILDLVNLQNGMDAIDINIGPARKESIFEWLVPIIKNHSNINVSFDTTNADEMRRGLELYGNCTNCFINSASKDTERFEKMTDLALEHNCNLILLTLDKETGIPKTSDGRLEIAFELYEKCLLKGLKPDKLFFDPLILPLSVDQNQAMEAINTIRMLKESFEQPVKTIIGLSNISNGSPNNVRPLINRVFACFASGSGCSSSISRRVQRVGIVPASAALRYTLVIQRSIIDLCCGPTPFLSICSIRDMINSDFTTIGLFSPYPSTIYMALSLSLPPADTRITEPRSPIASTRGAYSPSGSQIRISSSVFSIRKVISSFAENDLPEPGTPRRNADWFRRFALLHIMRL